jgi:hypothetical protein
MFLIFLNIHFFFPLFRAFFFLTCEWMCRTKRMSQKELTKTATLRMRVSQRARASSAGAERACAAAAHRYTSVRHVYGQHEERACAV